MKRLFTFSKMAAVIVQVSILCTSCRANTETRLKSGPTEPSVEMFVLSEGYRGPFLAVYGQEGGAIPQWKGDTALYSMPASGVLRIKMPEPPHRTHVYHSFANNPTVEIGTFSTCKVMSVSVADSAPRVCWLDFTLLGTGIPGHIIAVVTDQARIPQDFDRTTFVYDSVLFGGNGMAANKWESLAPIKRSRSIKASKASAVN